MKNILFINDGSFRNLKNDNFDSHNLVPSPSEILSPEFTFNQFADSKLSEIFTDKSFDLIVLPINVYQNYQAFQGISIALHIRLTPKWNHHKIPILFIGSESIEEILKLAPNPYIFSTSGIFTTQKKSIEDIKKQADWIFENKSNISEEEYQTFLSKINLTPPEFYDNRHSIANEWALLQLDDIFSIDSLKKKKELQQLQSDLYIKHLLLLNKNKKSLHKNTNSKIDFSLPDESKKNILVIEDEWYKGWLEFYTAIFGKNCNVDYLEINKGDTEVNIINKLKSKLKTQWDLILLDIRLLDSDHDSSKNYLDYTGFTLLSDYLIDKSEGGHPWNSIIVISASKLHKLHSYAKSLGVIGEFIKPGIEDDIDLNSFEVAISKAWKLSFYKRKFVNLLDSNFSSSNPSLPSSLQFFIPSVYTLLDITFNNIKSNQWDFAFFNLFAVIESYVSTVSTKNGISFPTSKEIIDNRGRWKLKYIKKTQNTPTHFIIQNNTPVKKERLSLLAYFSGVLAFSYSKGNDYLKKFGELNAMRNDIAHGKRNIVTENDFKQLLRFVEIINVP